MDAQASPAGAIVVFDAECVLCSANAQVILRRDSRRFFRLASMQCEAGSALLEANGVDPKDPDTIIVVTGSTVLRNSDAVLYIYRHLDWPWPAMTLFAMVPRTLRDAVYRTIARNRYRWFGRRAHCWLPAQADRDRVL